MIESGRILQKRYRIGKQIGQGGMGAVYVATDERFGSTVAIKETLCMDDNFRRAIEREARLLNSLKHAALPRVSDHFEEDNGLFLVMEYISGEDLCCVLDERGKPFPVAEMLQWGDQLLDALDFLHNQEIPVIHRDIKPQNLKLTPQGQVILLDFGLAKGNPTDASHQTAAKSIFGYSRNYASLEQIQGTGTDPRSDLYSLAATLYHLITRVPPEDALTRAMSVLAQKPDPLPPASAVDPSIPRGVSGVLQKALDLNADQRPSSAAEMRGMLRESEQYAYLSDAETFAATVPDARIYAQPTMLMPDRTDPDGNKFTGMDSEETSVVLSGSPANTNVSAAPQTYSAKSGRGIGFVTGALLMLLVGAAVAGGLYALKPSLFWIAQPNSTGPDSVVVPLSGNVNSSATINGDSAGMPSETATETDLPGANASNSSPGTTASERPAESTKNSKTVVTGKTKTQGQPDDVVEFNVDDPDIPEGGVVINQIDKNGKRTTMRVNPTNRSFDKQMERLNELDNFPRGLDPSVMTPAQRRRYNNAMKKAEDARRRVNRPPLPPQPTPRN